MTGTIYQLNQQGHGIVAQWGDDRVSRRAAQRVFDRHIARGDRIADLANGDGVFVENFDPDTQRELLVVTKMVGG